MSRQSRGNVEVCTKHEGARNRERIRLEDGVRLNLNTLVCFGVQN